ncbi:MAG: prepilin peptidase [Duganella sp.]
MPLPFPHLVLLPALLWVVLSDLLYRRIANRLVLALLFLWALHMIWMVRVGYGESAWDDTAPGLLAATLVLVLGYLLFAMRWVGAGDVKLMAVLCLWLGDQSFAFLIITSLCGGMLALALPLLRSMEMVLALLVVRLQNMLPGGPWALPMALREQSPHGIPYGLAIAAGAGFALYSA